MASKKQPKLSPLLMPDNDEEKDLFQNDDDNKLRLSVVKNIGTTPRDNRFPGTNQSAHCWNRYNEHLLCLLQTKGGTETKCAKLRQYAESICPLDWIEKWDEERDNDTFSGIGSRFDTANKKH